MTYVAVAALGLLVVAVGLALYFRSEAREAKREADRLELDLGRARSLRSEQESRLEAVIADQRGEIATLMEDLDACAVTSPAVVRERLSRVLSKAPGGGASTAMPQGVTAGGAASGSGGAT